MGVESKYGIHQASTEKKRCKTHGDYEAICATTPEGKLVYSECPKCEQDRIAIERRNRYLELEQRQKDGRIQEAFKRSCIPRLFRTIRFDDYNPTNKQAEDYKARLVKYCENFEKIKEAGACVLITGNTGTGKTTLACATLNQILQDGHTAMYTTSYEIIRHLKSSWVSGSQVSQDSLVKKYKDLDLLVIDEIGKGDGKKVSMDLLFEVINERYYNGLPSIFISIYNSQKLKSMFEPDSMRRFVHKGDAFHFNWETYKSEVSYKI